jgi:hypothetical protein
MPIISHEISQNDRKSAKSTQFVENKALKRLEEPDLQETPSHTRVAKYDDWTRA